MLYENVNSNRLVEGGVQLQNFYQDCTIVC